MADESQVVRSIHWREVFAFTHVFRAFRIAVHPSKIILAMMALLLLYGGGRVLDAVWSTKHRAVPGELELYESSATADAFSKTRLAARTAIEDQAAARIAGFNKAQWKKADGSVDREALTKYAHEKPGAAWKDIDYRVREDLEKANREAKTSYDERLAKAKDAAERETIEKERDAATASRFAAAREELLRWRALRGQGLFTAFFNYQTSQINNVVGGVLSNDWLSGPSAVAPSVIKFFTVAPGWALRHHGLYFVLFGGLFLFIWSLFGGAIARIAAVQVADEGRKLSVRQGLSFAAAKFLSYISAPLIPLIIIVVLGAIASVAGLLLNVPVLGEVVVGALFFVVLAIAFVMTLVLLGTAGGFNLMYPTIAVEGSDSFDAISRSFSYVYARPWRMLFYSAVALAYGAMTYLFVRLFVFVMLNLAFYFVNLFCFRQAASGADLWPTMLPAPSFWKLPYQIDYISLGGAQGIGAFLVSFWTYLVIALLGAFAISFYFSANTIIYYLIRREVDATEMDDVYLEQSEEDFAEMAPATVARPADPAPGAAPAAASPDVPTPPAGG